MSDEKQRPPSFWQVTKSVAAAAFGVQSEEARQRDFQHGSPAAFIVGGILFTVVFVVVIALVVRMVLRSAGVS
ncbi:hypothetical protein CAI21_05100 [Alkalilimnicola ehrlichii]|uniref:DUF2970 domain-containing protein n=1 Tax=Alkalilimnicola ehrlichii TaxID=351052 RepID=A0A3E0X0R0_9GAMM|nr:DUF2970 domain-containing protein [Alkalilimnicola ehrlichii]RFA30449.1 hypothetical protein CAI21_05100 [Alkalilimnicola ehrlichii]RFA38001.1 hypothetical protein CAL65_06470 [Alkalilimnicola ehrlichii]